MSQKKESIFLYIISMLPVESNQTERKKKKYEKKKKTSVTYNIYTKCKEALQISCF